MKLSKTDISTWLISAFALTGLVFLYIGATHPPASPYRLGEAESDSVFIEPINELQESPEQEPNLIIMTSDSLK